MSSIITDYNSLLERLFTEDSVDGIYNGLTLKMQAIAGGLAALFFLIAMVWEYAQMTIKGGGWMFRWSELSRLLMLWILIAIIPSLLSIPHLISGSLRKATANLSSDSNLSEYKRSVEARANYSEVMADPKRAEELSKNSYTTQDTQKDSEGNVVQSQEQNNDNNKSGYAADINAEGKEPSVWDVFDVITGTVSGAIGALITEIVLFLTQVAKMLIVAFCITASKVLLVLSPLAVVFSMLPWSKDKLGEWFGFYLSLLFTPVTCNIIDAVTLHLFVQNATTAANGSAETMDIFTTCAVNLTTLILYLYAFGLTKLYVGSADAGRALNQGVQTLMQGYTMLNTAKMANSMSGGEGGGGSAADAAQAGQDALKK